MFTRLTLNNFKCFSHFELDLTETKTTKKGKKLAIIYGENGIGKSCIIQAFALLKKTFTSFDRNIRYLNMLEKRKNDNRSKEEFLLRLEKEINNSRISYYIKDYFKIDELNNSMSVEYEGVLDNYGNKYIYKMVFATDSIVEESLFINEEEVFTAKRNQLSLSPRHFLSDELNKMLKVDFDMYFGLQTFLSSVSHRISSVTMRFNKTAFSKQILKLIDSFERIDIYTPTVNMYYSDYAFTRDNNLLDNVVAGYYDDDYKKAMENTKNLLTFFYSSLYTNIVGVDYDINGDIEDKEYSLVFLEKGTKNNIVRIPYSMESTGTKKLLALFTYFYNAVTSKDVLLIDEIDSGINDILLRNIINSMAEQIKGQLILTTHNTYLLNNKHKKYTYTLNRNSDNTISARCLDIFGNKIQEKTDVIGRYAKGYYGGLPQDKLIDFSCFLKKKN